jgi:hypothetical protein
MRAVCSPPTPAAIFPPYRYQSTDLEMDDWRM